MNDLISREAAIRAALRWYVNPDGGVFNAIKANIRSNLEQVPVVDAVPVVHARWIDIPDKPEWDQKMCSVCGDYFCCQNNYCPNCGAKMNDEGM